MKTHQGDLWRNIIRDLDSFSDETTMYILKELDRYVQRYNVEFESNFQAFETVRKKDRQFRLIKKGKSQIRNIMLAPHVQKRAVDYAEWVYSDKYKKMIWAWERKELMKLHKWLKENFPLFKLLRTGGDFKSFKDAPHYEVKRSIWALYNK